MVDMMAAGLDLEALHQQLSAFESRLDAWTRQSLSATEHTKDDIQAKLRSLHAESRNLEQERLGFEEQATKLRQRLAAEDSELHELQRVCEAAQAESRSLPPALQSLVAGLAEDRVREARVGAELSEAEAARARTLSSLRAALGWYRERLGLGFAQAPDGALQVSLCKVDPRDAERAWRLVVRVDRDRAYQVSDCVPSLPNLPALAASLGASRDFGTFVRGVRREARQLVAREMEA